MRFYVSLQGWSGRIRLDAKRYTRFLLSLRKNLKKKETPDLSMLDFLLNSFLVGGFI